MKDFRCKLTVITEGSGGKLLRAVKAKARSERRFIVVDGRSGRIVLDFIGETLLCNQALVQLVVMCSLQSIDIKQLQFMVELPTLESHEARTSITDMVQRVKECVMPNKELTSREKEVLAGVLEGLSNKEIANNVHLSVRTIKFHVSNLLTKFNVTGRGSLSQKTIKLEKL